MKKVIAIVLILCLALGCTGCRLPFGIGNETVVFYYEQAQYQYGEPDAVIFGEERDITGHVSDMQYLLSLYMMGPISDTLHSPFPTGMQVLDVKVRMDLVRITVSEELNTLSDARYSLALACLAMTCLELSEQESVVIVCGEDHVVLDRSMFTLSDNGAQIQDQKGETP